MSFDQLVSAVGNLLPATVVVAVALFVIREALEFVRRRRSERRRLSAIKHLLAREVEVNFFAAGSLRGCLHTMGEWLLDRQTDLFIRTDAAGQQHLTHITLHSGEGSSVIRGGIDVALQKYLLDAATLDRQLFVVAERALDEVVEMRHVKDSLVSYVLDSKERESWHADGFVEYGLKQLDDTVAALKALYLVCTGRELTKGMGRVR